MSFLKGDLYSLSYLISAKKTVISYIVLYDRKIHHSKLVVDAINKTRYKPLFVLRYSPFLNSIEVSTVVTGLFK